MTACLHREQLRTAYCSQQKAGRLHESSSSCSDQQCGRRTDHQEKCSRANIGLTGKHWVEPWQDEKNKEAAARMDAIMNRLFIEPALGLGYPEDTMPMLKKLKSHYEDGDGKMIFDFVLSASVLQDYSQKIDDARNEGERDNG
jgi:hypothetical protein